jgi:hypothetical protein
MFKTPSQACYVKGSCRCTAHSSAYLLRNGCISYSLEISEGFAVVPKYVFPSPLSTNLICLPSFFFGKYLFSKFFQFWPTFGLSMQRSLFACSHAIISGNHSRSSDDRPFSPSFASLTRQSDARPPAGHLSTKGLGICDQ